MLTAPWWCPKCVCCWKTFSATCRPEGVSYTHRFKPTNPHVLVLANSSIQFILYRPTSQICLWVLYNLHTYDIPVPGPHIGSGKTPKKKIKPFSWRKKGRNLGGRGISSAMASDPARSNGPYETSQRLRRGSRVNDVQWRDDDSSIRREKRREVLGVS